MITLKSLDSELRNCRKAIAQCEREQRWSQINSLLTIQAAILADIEKLKKITLMINNRG